MFRRVEFQNFKGLANFSLTLKGINVLTGPNNAGKSTLLDGFRALSGAYRYASRFLPNRVFDSSGREYRGYKIPSTYLPITVTNIQTDYNNDDSLVTFHLENGRKLILLFDRDQYCRLLLDQDSPHISTTYQFRKTFPVNLSIVPTLGPLEEEEELLSDEYVTRWGTSRRSHRMLRNIWFRKPATEFK